MDQFTAHLDRGWDLVSRGDYAGALISAQKSLELDAESPEAHNLLGFIHQAEGRAEDALDHYRQAIAIDETYVEAMLNAAEVLIHSLRDLDNGLAMVDEALDFAEGDDEVADGLLLRFDALMQQGDRDGAATVATKLPAGPFENAQLDFMIGRAKFETGDLDGAEKHLELAVKREGPSGDAFYYQGLVREARGDLRGATLAFLQAREADLNAPKPPWSLSATNFERRVQNAVRKLPTALAETIDGALVVVSDIPGPEVVAEGVDPHIGVLIDDLQDAGGQPVATEAQAERAGRVFVYQRNVERWADNAGELEDEILRTLEHELSLTFPQLVPK
jgi:Flp pilus assembly protein TadD/predicted Zn-dependent protease with MMP-like domain